MTPLEQVWHVARCDPAALSRVAVTGGDPQLPSVYRVAGLATAVIAAEALAAAECFRVRTGREQQVEVDARRACVAFRSERYLRIDNGPAPEMRDPLTGFFETRDGRWIQLHANFAHHRAGIVKLLGCADDPDSVAAAIRNRDGAALDQALGEAGLCAALIRSPEEWAALPQAQAVAKLPLMEIERIGDAPAMPIGDPAGAAPLSGVRALDLSRIIAGPVGGRTLAQHCADVLLINGPHLPNIAPLVIDNGRGKRSATLDLREPRGRDSLRTLLGQSDVFLQSYRPQALASRGFGPEDAARIKPGIVYVTVSAYGHEGPWSARRGFDSLVQSASGIAWTEARAAGQEKPRHLPCQALDHATGYLAAFGAMVALLRRATEGGSWLVRVSLAQTGRWLQSMDTLDGGQRTQDPTFDDVQDALMTMDSPFGKLTCTQPAERMPLTPPRWTRPPVPIGTDEARW
ncbi:L-carnitine dehydratase/bile acid-inducible protein F [Caballeronia arationis]|jgi:crotonobetainyl-CoA:carnitine CoA-transferase CaiB-like acyl-CoA transferase|uniref:CoA-transferase family III n=1 Tax=Caballeronia arationis TaxID=1777142 RepID=A0A7Z7N559_9BURK|nr:CoA transferase [Caballeronia arationis]SAK62221.1 L-carnitine dehydratase/bile acid-inducible protein F [Caballeronia arationis]SOE82510.1 CoA-transferase family III [Caballeronia arationis]